MKWQKPELIDLAMATFDQACVEGNSVNFNMCGPVGSAALSTCNEGSGVVE